MIRLLLVALLGPGAVWADEVFDPAPVEACLEGAASRGEALDCVGRGARACWEAEGSSAPIIVGPCLGAENAYWEARMAAALEELRDRAGQTDADHGGLGRPASAVESLDGAQAAWESFRDAACDYVTAVWGPGSGQGPAWMACVLQRTAEQALWLEERLTID